MEEFIQTVVTTDDKAKALSLLKMLVLITHEADNSFLLKLIMVII